MTTKEEQSVEALRKMLYEIKEENKKHREDVAKQVEQLSNKVEQKHLPLSLEQEVLNTLTSSLNTAFAKVVSDSYNSPLKKYADNIIAKYQTDIEAVFDKIVSEGIQTEEFKASVRVTFLNKLAKTVISGIDGSIDKTVTQMKQDSIFRSRLTLAVNGLVEEFINKR